MLFLKNGQLPKKTVLFSARANPGGVASRQSNQLAKTMSSLIYGGKSEKLEY